MIDVEKWWDGVRYNAYWSGAVVGTLWEDLFDDAKEEILIIYLAAINVYGESP